MRRKDCFAYPATKSQDLSGNHHPLYNLMKIVIALLVGCALATTLLTFTPQSSPKGDPVYEKIINAKAQVLTRKIAESVKKKEGKVKYVDYTSSRPVDTLMPHLTHTRAKIITSNAKVYSITYMEDTRDPKKTKDYLGNWIEIFDETAREKFSDQDLLGIPSLSGQPEKTERSVWVRKYRAVLEEIYGSM